MLRYIFSRTFAHSCKRLHNLSFDHRCVALPTMQMTENPSREMAASLACHGMDEGFNLGGIDREALLRDSYLRGNQLSRSQATEVKIKAVERTKVKKEKAKRQKYLSPPKVKSRKPRAKSQNPLLDFIPDQHPPAAFPDWVCVWLFLRASCSLRASPAEASPARPVTPPSPRL